MLVMMLTLAAVCGVAQTADGFPHAHKQRTFSGAVTDSKGEPLVGASVFWTETHDGTVTDGNGRFSLTGRDGDRLLVASFIGYDNDTVDATALADGQAVGFVLHESNYDLGEVTVTERRAGQTQLKDVTNGVLINQEELFKAACCNLGESFTTTPSVDVNYSDAATGAKQIKLLGLSGTYVQMLTENIPNFRGAAMPYALGYVPGPWMESIQVSKGA
ncbi:MAG: carboxypeptidase-like regulatory domain-containing protein, partial [Paludibacteraceae bacterium]|nr:carboxypeptidase-like regulatory domain-containing protein [Paludibacteraceae bacterium]